MICATMEEAVDRAVRYVRQGHLVAYAVGHRCKYRTALQMAADQLAGHGYAPQLELQGVVLDGRLVIRPRVPFMAGSGILGWEGAIVVDPSAKDMLYGNRMKAMRDLVAIIHAKAGVIE